MASVASLKQFQPRGAINETITLTISSTGVPQTFPARRIPPGLAVTLRSRSANVASIFVSPYREHLTDGQGREIVPGGIAGSAITFPVNHLGEIWVQGTAGDKLTAEISGAPIG